MVKRWWEQYCKLPWPDTVAIYLKGLVVGQPGKQRVMARVIRRTVIRYCLLAYILCIRRLSSRLKKRFPNMFELVKTGIVRSDEAMRIGNEESLEMYKSQERWIHYKCSWLFSHHGKSVKVQRSSDRSQHEVCVYIVVFLIGETFISTILYS